MIQGETDFSDGYNQVCAQINAETGGAYSRFVKGLRPNYTRLWRDMAFGFAALFLSLVLAILPSGVPARLIAAILCARLAGYAIAYLHLFIHEAAHYNLARDRASNDFLCDLLISWQVVTRVADYRPSHFAHHRDLGQTTDTERSYFNALTPRFVFEMLSGIHALRVLLSRRKDAGVRTDGVGDAPSNDKPKRDLTPPLRGLAVYGLIAAVLFALGAWPAILTLGLGLVIFFPLFATLRQLLEHRSERADPMADYAAVPHGAVTRIFGDGPLASTLGGVGFNRHLLHHWEPEVSYTRLKDLEAYVTSTQAGAILDLRRTTYLKAARAAGHDYHCQRFEDFESPRKFDLILMLNIIEHVKDPTLVLAKARALLSDGGEILIKTPNHDSLDAFAAFDLARGLFMRTSQMFVILKRA